MCSRGMAAIRLLRMFRLIWAQIFRLEVTKRSMTAVTEPSEEFSMGTTPYWAFPAVHHVKHVLEALAGNKLAAFSELLERRLVAPGSLGAQVGDGQPSFQEEGAGDDFPVNGLQGGFRENARIRRFSLPSRAVSRSGTKMGELSAFLIRPTS